MTAHVCAKSHNSHHPGVGVGAGVSAVPDRMVSLWMRQFASTAQDQVVLPCMHASDGEAQINAGHIHGTQEPKKTLNV